MGVVTLHLGSETLQFIERVLVFRLFTISSNVIGLRLKLMIYVTDSSRFQCLKITERLTMGVV